ATVTSLSRPKPGPAAHSLFARRAASVSMPASGAAACPADWPGGVRGRCDRARIVDQGGSRMRLTALVEGPDHVCCRYRVAAFRPFPAHAGPAVELRPWPRSWWSRLTLHRTLGGADAVLVQRKLLPGWRLSLLRAAAPRLIFDLDDAVFLRDSYSHKGPHDPG